MVTSLFMLAIQPRLCHDYGMGITASLIGTFAKRTAEVVRVERHRALLVLPQPVWFSLRTGRSEDGRWQADLSDLRKPRRVPPVLWVV